MKPTSIENPSKNYSYQEIGSGSHKMETGLRKDSEGKKIPRSIINRFTCDFNGENVLDVGLDPAISVNPYFQFDAVVPESGEFMFTWYDDDGSVYEKTKKITVT